MLPRFSAWPAALIGLLLANSLSAQYEILRIDANPAKGFHWPYYLTLPVSLKTPAVLLVIPNNTGYPSDDQNVHDLSARREAEQWTLDVDMSKLGSPVLVPTFPRPGQDRYGYPHALDRRILLTNVPNLVRLDLQLIAMIEDARSRLAARKISIDAKVWMFGFSASGSFCSRFTALHPEVVKAASVGAPYICPILPVAEWNGVRLPYMVGIADLQALTGKAFDLAAFRQVPQFIYIGGDEVFDAAVGGVTPYDPDGFYRIARDALGAIDIQYSGVEAAYNSVGASAQVIIFPGLEHDYTDRRYYVAFFERYRASSPPPAPKPLLYKTYFPHVACSSDWNTSVTLLSGSPGVPVRGELIAYRGEGGTPLAAAPFTIPGAGSIRIAVKEAFADFESVSYLAVRADSAFISGEATLSFLPLASRVSIPATSGTYKGSFVRMQGWSGIGLVNLEDASASVSLSALDEKGSAIANATLELGPGAKMFGEPGGIFGVDVSTAAYVRFVSNRRLAGLGLNVLDGGAVLEATTALPDYVR